MKNLALFFVVTSLSVITLGLKELGAGHPKKAAQHQDKYKGFAVLEFFTSEGCSSCPPADEVIARLEKEVKDKPVYILAYHVDYWNKLGWDDPFSSSLYSKRQYNYAQQLNLRSVYTPQLVVNGREEFVGSDENKLRKAMTTQLSKTYTATVNLSHLKLNTVQVSIDYLVKGPVENSSLVLALVQKTAVSDVSRGENQGHKLSHVQIVRQFQIITLKDSMDGSYSFKLPQKDRLKAYEIIAFLQNNSTGQITAANKSGVTSDGE